MYWIIRYRHYINKKGDRPEANGCKWSNQKAVNGEASQTKLRTQRKRFFLPLFFFPFPFFSSFFRKKARRQKNKKKKERYTPRGGDEEGKRERSIKIWFQESESYDTWGKIRASYDGFYALAWLRDVALGEWEKNGGDGDARRRRLLEEEEEKNREIKIEMKRESKRKKIWA